ncbi:MAG TPA: hypothetical protein GX503_07030 [Clostridiales bacterium]|nr:hypothetical protein [Clostridiales bacterium]
MRSIIRTHGIRERIMEDLIELNGFHEVTDREINLVTQPEWKAILSKHYPQMNLEGKHVSVDLDEEIIILD